MASEAQIRANRENAKKSTGAVTPEGKRASSRNSTIHGIFISVPALDEEERDQLHKLYITLCEDYVTVTLSESLLVWDMAVAHFRRQRAIDVETEYYLADRLKFEETNPGEEWTPAAAARRLTLSGDLPKMTRYQRTFERTWEKRLAELRSLQADRRARERKAEQDFEEEFHREFEARGAESLANIDKLYHETMANSPFTQAERDQMNALLASVRKEQKK